MKKWIGMAAGLAIAFAFTLYFSYEMKRPCLEQPWGEPKNLQYFNLCYNDIQGLYGVRKLDQRAFPYFEEKSYEYPVLMGLTMWATSLFAHNHVEYFNANVPVLTLFAALSLVGLWGAIGARRELLWFAAGTPLLFYTYLNWDMLAVACVCLAMWAWSRGKLAATGSALGLGVAAKIYPAFLIPSLMITLWKRGDQKQRRRDVLLLVGSAAGAWLAVNVPMIAAEWLKTGAIDGWLGVFAFHARRSPDFGTVWHWFQRMVADDKPTFLALMPPIALGWIIAWATFKSESTRRRWPLIATGLFAMVMLTVVMRSNAIRGADVSENYKELVDRTSQLIFAMGAVSALFMQWKYNRAPWATGGAVLSLYLVVSKIHSPQHALWILPLMIAVETPRKTLIAYLVGDALVFVSGFLFFAHSQFVSVDFWEGAFALGVFVRAISLAVFSVQCCTSIEDRLNSPVGTDRSKSDMHQSQVSKVEMAA